MAVIFDFRASRHGKTKLTEETFNTAVNGTKCDRMRQTAVLVAPRQGDIDGFSGQTGVKRCASSSYFTLRACCTCSFAALMTAPAAGRSSGGRDQCRVVIQVKLNALSAQTFRRVHCAQMRQHLPPR